MGTVGVIVALFLAAKAFGGGGSSSSNTGNTTLTPPPPPPQSPEDQLRDRLAKAGGDAGARAIKELELAFERAMAGTGSSSSDYSYTGQKIDSEDDR